MPKIISHFIEPHRFRLTPWSDDGTIWWHSYYLKPWALAYDLFREGRAILRRGLFGWDSSDVWSLDRTLASTIAAQLRHLATNKHGTPVDFLDERFTATNDPDVLTDEEWDGQHDAWTAWLNARAQDFEHYIQLMEHDYWDELVPWTDWKAFLDAHPKDWMKVESPFEQVSEVERVRAREIWEGKMDAALTGMTALFEHFQSLWN